MHTSSYASVACLFSRLNNPNAASDLVSVAHNAPPEELQPHPDPNLLEGGHHTDDSVSNPDENNGSVSLSSSHVSIDHADNLVQVVVVNDSDFKDHPVALLTAQIGALADLGLSTQNIPKMSPKLKQNAVNALNKTNAK